MGLVERVSTRAIRALGRPRRRSEDPLDWDEYQGYFGLGGPGFPWIQMTMGSLDREKVAASAVAAYKTSGPVFALIMARMQVFSQVKFQWTHFQGSQPGDLFDSPELGVLDTPWPGGTTGKLLARMEMHNSLAGNAYIRRTRPTQLNVLRPDFVTIVLGSQENEADPALAADTEIAGYYYTPAGAREQIFLPEEIAHYAPVPDPWFHFLGQSWITPVLRDLQADQASTEHKWRFFENNATTNLVISFDPSVDVKKVQGFKQLLEAEHRGISNAYRTLYLGGGADAKTLGMSMKDMDYAVIQGRAESRLAAAAGVPPSWVGFSEGLQGSALNAGNFDSARRRFSDGTLVHLWSEAAASLQPILTAPDPKARLWYDSRVPFMREDAGDLAKIQQQEAVTIQSLINAGFKPATVVKAVDNNDWSLLKHSGLTSVQLVPPGGQEPVPGFGDPGTVQPSPGTPADAAPAPGNAVTAATASSGSKPPESDGSSAAVPAKQPAGKKTPTQRAAADGYPAGDAPGAGSGMISLDLPPGVVDPVPGGVTDHHITIVYLGADVDDDQFEAACQRAAQAAASVPGPLDGYIGGIGTFPPKEEGAQAPVWAAAQVPGAYPLRAQLEDLSRSGRPGWIPHVTLMFADPGDPLPVPVPPVPVSFPELSVHRGQDVKRFPFGTPAPAA